jgi:hypothetical protein
MQAEQIEKSRIHLGDDRFAEVAIWRLAQPLAGSAHAFKYRLALVVAEVCVLRYDNEAGKGDHKHLGGRQVPYTFTTLDRLVDDFWADAAPYLR